jgi:alkylated DNA repair dioxygenase AlkB
MTFDLFSSIQDKSHNMLPYDGIVNYFGTVFSPEQARHYREKLLHNIEWKNDEAYIYGKHFITKRKVAWYGDEPYSYTYSKLTKQALPWTPELLELKKLAELQTESTYNSCLLNLYHDGDEGMSWHSDDEKTLLKNGAIASYSFGADRMFSFKHKSTGEKVNLLLENGSLLLMKGETQTYWLHQLPKRKKVQLPRINLTFRSIIP